MSHIKKNYWITSNIHKTILQKNDTLSINIRLSQNGLRVETLRLHHASDWKQFVVFTQIEGVSFFSIFTSGDCSPLWSDVYGKMAYFIREHVFWFMGHVLWVNYDYILIGDINSYDGMWCDDYVFGWRSKGFLYFFQFLKSKS